MKRWNSKKCCNIENEKIDSFLNEIFEICKKYNISISHEDTHGAFKIEKYNTANIDWLNSASDDIEQGN